MTGLSVLVVTLLEFISLGTADFQTDLAGAVDGILGRNVICAVLVR